VLNFKRSINEYIKDNGSEGELLSIPIEKINEFLNLYGVIDKLKELKLQNKQKLESIEEEEEEVEEEEEDVEEDVEVEEEEEEDVEEENLENEEKNNGAFWYDGSKDT